MQSILVLTSTYPRWREPLGLHAYTEGPPLSSQPEGAVQAVQITLSGTGSLSYRRIVESHALLNGVCNQPACTDSQSLTG
jgi:hypothetical protein